jgi:Family of unknown function (DUF6166)
MTNQRLVMAEPRRVRYVGQRTDQGCVVYCVVPGLRQEEVPLRNDLRNHSPCGINWGYGGSGPAQLALALLAHYTRDDDLALRLHQRFKRAFVSRWGDHWELPGLFIEAWLLAEGFTRANPLNRYASINPDSLQSPN